MAKRMNFPFVHPHCVVLSTVVYSLLQAAREEMEIIITSHTGCASKWRKWNSLIETFKIIQPFFSIARETRNDRTTDSNKDWRTAAKLCESEGNHSMSQQSTRIHIWKQSWHLLKTYIDTNYKIIFYLHSLNATNDEGAKRTTRKKRLEMLRWVEWVIFPATKLKEKNNFEVHTPHSRWREQ